MAEPKKRLTSARSGGRRSHLAAKTNSLSACPKCQSTVAPHHVCPTCGHYKGSDILQLEKKAQAKEARRKEREKQDENSKN